MASSIPFVWKESFALGIPLIDAEHRQFFDIMNRCARAAAEGASPTTLACLLKELATYADIHFCHEEEALDRVGFPGLARQREEHGAFLWDLARLESNQSLTVLAAMAVMRDWLVEHILGTDRAYVSWLEKDRAALRWG
jgi:hemerythrin-like metal-binding protein